MAIWLNLQELESVRIADRQKGTKTEFINNFQLRYKMLKTLPNSLNLTAVTRKIKN